KRQYRGQVIVPDSSRPKNQFFQVNEVRDVEQHFGFVGACELESGQTTEFTHSLQLIPGGVTEVGYREIFQVPRKCSNFFETLFVPVSGPHEFFESFETRNLLSQ